MACWPVYVTGSLALALLIFDMIVQQWNDLLMHALGGVILTLVLWGLCFINTGLSAAVLIVPSFAALVFIITIWITGQSLKRRGCCMNCQTQPERPPSPISSSTEKCEDNTLKATPVL